MILRRLLIQFINLKNPMITNIIKNYLNYFQEILPTKICNIYYHRLLIKISKKMLNISDSIITHNSRPSKNKTPLLTQEIIIINN